VVGSAVTLAVPVPELDGVWLSERDGVLVLLGVAVRVVVVDDVPVRVLEMVGVRDGVTQLGPIVST
jgi:hypothetical protein